MKRKLKNLIFFSFITQNKMEDYKSEHIKPLYGEKDLQLVASDLAQKIVNEHKGNQQDLVMLCVMNGASYFFADLTKAMSRHGIYHAQMSYIRVKSYEGTESTGEVRITGDPGDLNGKHIIIVEDIVDTGLTIQKLIFHLTSNYAVKGIQVCALFKKDSDRIITDIGVDYLGWNIEDYFVVGYGLDYNGRYRNLPYVGILSFSEAVSEAVSSTE